MLVLLFLLWIIFNGKLTLEIAVFGVVFTGIIYWFMAAFMNYSWQKEKLVYRLFPLGVKYFLILVWEIIKANVVMLGIVTRDKYEMEPVIVHFAPELSSEAARVVLANSITLTPGTYTVGMDEKELQVHCLDKDFSIELESSVFVRQLKRIEQIAYESRTKEAQR